MFSTIDRYIARQYLFNVVALMVVLFSFVVTVDVTLNLDRFMNRAERIEAEAAERAVAAAGSAGNPAEAGAPAAAAPPPRSALRRGLVTTLLVFDLWWPRLLQLYNYTIGLCLVGAMGFTFTQLVRHREMVAVLAGGISLYRLLWPVFLVAALMTGLKLLNQELAISHPSVAPLLARDPGDAGNRQLTEFQVPLTADGRGQVWFARNFDPASAVMTGVEIWRRDERGVVTARITADRATWRIAHGEEEGGGVAGGGNGGGWDLENPRVLLAEMGALGAGSQPGRSREVAAPARIETDLEPSTLLFKRFASFRQCLSWSQIGQMLRSPHLKPELREELQRIRWARISTAISSLLALAITMPFFLMREPKNMLVQSLKCAPVGIVSLMGGTLLAAMPVPGLPAGFAVFLPVLVLLPIAAAVLSTLRT